MSRPHFQATPNITPLIDVLLVLLIMFLFGVRLSQEGIDVSLPEATGPPSDAVKRTADVVLEYSAERRITVNSQEVSRAALGGLLRGIYQNRPDKTMWLAGAGSLKYGEIVDIIDAAKGAGVERVGVITPEMRRGSSR